MHMSDNGTLKIIWPWQRKPIVFADYLTKRWLERLEVERGNFGEL